MRHARWTQDDDARGHGAHAADQVLRITLPVIAVTKRYDAGNAATLPVGCVCEVGGKWGTMRGMKFSLMIPIAVLGGGCAPPVAPAELQQLACFIFDHTDDEEDETLQVALDNLYVWFDQDHEEDIEEGYQIDLLLQSVVSDLEGDNHELRAELIGAAVAHPTSKGVDELAYTTSVADWEEVIGEDQYEYYDREFTENGECIADRGCMQAAARSESELVQLGISVTSKNRIEYRWVETSYGWAFVQRSWLTEPPVVSSDLVNPNSQYFLAVTLPREPAVRLQATWIDTEIAGIQIPKNQVVKTMRAQGDTVEVWMTENL